MKDEIMTYKISSTFKSACCFHIVILDETVQHKEVEWRGDKHIIAAVNKLIVADAFLSKKSSSTMLVPE